MGVNIDGVRRSGPAERCACAKPRYPAAVPKRARRRWNGRQGRNRGNVQQTRRGGPSDSGRGWLKRLAESKETANVSYFFPPCLGVLEAAQRDFAAGALFDMRALISAEILGDFVEQAEALLEAGYWHPAASLSGAVLEDTLRKLCAKRGVPVPDTTKIDRLNADLAKAGVYDKLVQKRITALADIRNNADHGHFDKFTKEDVDDFVKWLRRFSADYLG